MHHSCPAVAEEVWSQQRFQTLKGFPRISKYISMSWLMLRAFSMAEVSDTGLALLWLPLVSYPKLLTAAMRMLPSVTLDTSNRQVLKPHNETASSLIPLANARKCFTPSGSHNTVHHTPGAATKHAPGADHAPYCCCKLLMSLQGTPLSQLMKPVNVASMLNIFVSKYSDHACSQTNEHAQPGCKPKLSENTLFAHQVMSCAL